MSRAHASSPPAPTCSPTPSPARPSTSSASTGVRRCPAPRPTWPTVATDPRRPDANRQAVEAMLGVTGPPRRRRARLRGARPRAAASSCTPARRSSGHGRPARCAARSWAAPPSRAWSTTPRTPVALFESGSSVSLEPCHHRSAVGPMAGVVTPSMWMWVLEDRADRAADVLLPQRGPRQGAALRRLLPRGARPGCAGWATCSARCCRPPSAAPRRPIDVTGILTQMLQMGDEAHNRNRAGTLMLLRDLAPAMVSSGSRRRHGRRRRAALRRRQRPLLPQPRDAGVQARARRRPRHPRLDDGRGDGAQRHRLRHPGLRHRRRVVHRPRAGGRGPLPRRLRPRRRQPRHRRLGDHRDRRHRRLRDGDRPGDRPARRRLGARRPGHHPPDARDHARRRTRAGRCPILEFRGTPTGIDVTQGAAAPAILPQINTGMAGKVAGVGQVGAGLVTPPAEIFPKALAALARIGSASAGRSL